ncbi:MAG: hypothetical protein QXS40_03230 [Candidatus Nitrosocaldus sp.]
MDREFMLNRSTGIVAAAGIALMMTFAIAYVIPSSTAAEEGMKTDVVRDTVTLLLDWKRIDPNDFILIYDASPYHIMSGHVALRVPCDADGKPVITVLVGSAEDGLLEEPEMMLLDKVSEKGKMCVYHADLTSTHEEGTAMGKIVDVALKNPHDRIVTLPRGSSVVVGVNEIMKSEEHSNGH